MRQHHPTDAMQFLIPQDAQMQEEAGQHVPKKKVDGSSTAKKSLVSIGAMTILLVAVAVVCI